MGTTVAYQQSHELRQGEGGPVQPTQLRLEPMSATSDPVRHPSQVQGTSPGCPSSDLLWTDWLLSDQLYTTRILTYVYDEMAATKMMVSPYYQSPLTSHEHANTVYATARLASIWMEPLIPAYQALTGVQNPLVWETIPCPARRMGHNEVFLVSDLRDALLQAKSGFQTGNKHIDFYKATVEEDNPKKVVIDKQYTYLHLTDEPLKDDMYVSVQWFLTIRLVDTPQVVTVTVTLGGDTYNFPIRVYNHAPDGKVATSADLTYKQLMKHIVFKIYPTEKASLYFEFGIEKLDKLVLYDAANYISNSAAIQNYDEPIKYLSLIHI